MDYHIVTLTDEHLNKLLPQAKLGISAASLRQAYFSVGSVANCLLADGEPVLAGGIVNMQWSRGEAWILPTPFLYKHIKTCYRVMKDGLIMAATVGRFKRVQATCSVMTSTILFQHLDFHYEGTLKRFGPNGETCYMYARIF